MSSLSVSTRRSRTSLGGSILSRSETPLSIPSRIRSESVPLSSRTPPLRRILAVHDDIPWSDLIQQDLAEFREQEAQQKREHRQAQQRQLAELREGDAAKKAQRARERESVKVAAVEQGEARTALVNDALRHNQERQRKQRELRDTLTQHRDAAVQAKTVARKRQHEEEEIIQLNARREYDDSVRARREAKLRERRDVEQYLSFYNRQKHEKAEERRRAVAEEKEAIAQYELKLQRQDKERRADWQRIADYQTRNEAVARGVYQQLENTTAERKEKEVRDQEALDRKLLAEHETRIQAAQQRELVARQMLEQQIQSRAASGVAARLERLQETRQVNDMISIAVAAERETVARRRAQARLEADQLRQQVEQHKRRPKHRLTVKVGE